MTGRWALVLALALTTLCVDAARLATLSQHSSEGNENMCLNPIRTSEVFAKHDVCRPLATGSARLNCDTGQHMTFEEAECQGPGSAMDMCPDSPAAKYTVSCEEVPEGEYATLHLRGGSCNMPGGPVGTRFFRMGCNKGVHPSFASTRLTVSGYSITVEHWTGSATCSGPSAISTTVLEGECTESAYPHDPGYFELSFAPRTFSKMATVVVYPSSSTNCSGTPDYKRLSGIDGECVRSGNQSYRVTCEDQTYRAYYNDACAGPASGELRACPSPSSQSMQVTCKDVPLSEYVTLLTREGGCDQTDIKPVETFFLLGCSSPERSSGATESRFVSVVDGVVTYRVYSDSNTCSGTGALVENLSVRANECVELHDGSSGVFVINTAAPTLSPTTPAGSTANDTNVGTGGTKSPTSMSSSIELSHFMLAMIYGSLVAWLM